MLIFLSIASFFKTFQVSWVTLIDFESCTVENSTLYYLWIITGDDMDLKRKILPIVVLSGLISNSYAAFNALTVHSRANCGGFNESISWNARAADYYRTQSYHFRKKTDRHAYCILDTYAEYTRRSAAYHYAEAWAGNGWFVSGVHYYYPNKHEAFLAATTAEDCSIYDGWWDFNP